MDGVLVKIVDTGPTILLLVDIGHCGSHTLLVLFLEEVGEGDDEADVESMSEVIIMRLSHRRIVAGPKTYET